MKHLNLEDQLSVVLSKMAVNSFYGEGLREIDGGGLFVARTKLFMPGDIGLISFSNGGGERCRVTAWSSKKSAVIAHFYTRYARHTVLRKEPRVPFQGCAYGHWAWHPQRSFQTDGRPMKWFVIPGEVRDSAVASLPDLRNLLLDEFRALSESATNRMPVAQR